MRMIQACILSTMLVAAATATAGILPDVACVAAKNKVAGAYLSCLHKTQAAAVKKGELPDYTKCSAKFVTKWDAAETKGAGACPDTATTPAMDQFLASAETVNALILSQDTGLPSCGDGSINRVGEQCDGSDFGSLTCATFGYVSGSLSCDGSCHVGAGACSLCPADTVEYGGSCWVTGSNGGGTQSCDGACSAKGLPCNEVALVAVGSGGTDADCAAVLDVLAPSGAPWSPTPIDLSSCGSPSQSGLGCAFQFGFPLSKRVTGPTTTCAADNSGPSCSLGGAPSRACACSMP